MKRKEQALLRPYRAALRRYLRQASAANLRPAQRLGREAMARAMTSLDLSLVHEEALIREALPIKTAAVRDRIVAQAGTFFAETILPLEETHRTAVEANARLKRLIQELEQRSVDLADSNRKLKKEIARRATAEKSLRQSERESGLLLAQSRLLQEQLRLLSRRILSAQEEERKRISRELHDVIAQMLTGINVRLATLQREATGSTRGFSQKIAKTQRLVEQSVDVVHRFARELRPAVLDDLGLIPALHAHLKAFMKATGTRVSLTAFAEVEQLSSAKRTALYRVAQEALTNVSRHAHASRVDVSIQRLPQAVRMQIRDDGKSFPVEQMWHARKTRHLGVLGMRERMEMIGGTFAVESAPGHGTTVLVQVPFRSGNKESKQP